MATPQEIVKRMMELDAFSQWLGIEVLAVEKGYSKLQMTVRNEMLNAFGIAHGGITFAFADSAFAFACNSEGKITVALDVSISFPHPVRAGDVIIAEAKQVNETNKTGLYLIEVKNEAGKLVALFKGTCFRTNRDLEIGM
jgi:acyl-CoA thioesterase